MANKYKILSLSPVRIGLAEISTKHDVVFMVMEDEFLIRTNAESTLKKENIKFVRGEGLAEKGLARIEKLWDMGMAPHVVLMDIHLAGVMSGIEMAKTIYEKYCIFSVFISAFDDESHRNMAAQLPVLGYYTKPLSADALMAAVLSTRETYMLIADFIVKQRDLLSELREANQTISLEKSQLEVALGDLRQANGDLEQTQLELSDQNVKLVETSHRLEAAWRVAMAAQKAMESAELSKSNFFHNMSHELRTPLNAIIGYAELMTTLQQAGILSLAQSESYIELIHEAGHRLLVLITNILDMAALNANQMKLAISEFALNNTVEELEVWMTSTMQSAQKNIQYDVCFDVELSPIMVGDEKRLAEVLHNILGNALQFTPDQGRIRLSIKGEGDHVRFTITDSGEGMPQSLLDHVFEPFSEAKSSAARKFGGMGLGLAKSKQLVEHMGGTISAESIQGRGTTISFTIIAELLPGALV